MRMLYIDAFLKKRGRLQSLRVITISVKNTYPNILIEGPLGALFFSTIFGRVLEETRMLYIGAFLKKRGRLQSLRVITISVKKYLSKHSDRGSIRGSFFLDDFWACPWRDAHAFWTRVACRWRNTEDNRCSEWFGEAEVYKFFRWATWIYIVSYIDEMVCLVLSSLGQSATRQITQWRDDESDPNCKYNYIDGLQNLVSFDVILYSV